ncbi:MAG: 16S rRNA (cytosine(1402)-N(4))-methyltransferase RsmH [Lachnospiraceae bacterium]|jgi:16S rRNA (cytosine1402-N4)-methyltransferase|nr:16S rRNA (cytosine(1402)-N(4))-methyltransferase RsmH [Lachnospiraceae bacterium]MCI9097388.1 16S rRNA (cytosine(1402)-N(4))-methyltransferase RsmH [Lachnospiraceae bacterium]MCI9202896.1 16S rRNA (cytosine(1402)-N(4))-methyltransferase RsmH [Lachnospiraceae bacterium]MCI9333583.1 16S rRNA (cytosine(1402)-N(4))-methyltransferase RsmH [Lachnospiraceae bacterium]
MAFEHTSVLLKETIEGLEIKPEGTYVDGTLGGGGHAREIAACLGEGGRLVGIDQDEAAIRAAGERLAPFGDRVTIIRSNYRDTKEILALLGIREIDGMLLDLGVSSYQLDTRERGFSYRFDTPLDMRMDQRQRLTAKEIINTYEERELFRIIRDYGEDKFAKNIAKHIVQARQKKLIETTGELNEIIKAAIPAKMRAEGGHPSKRTFQAIRIECNRELEVLKESIEELICLLAPGGRLCIITFHSLEDRIVKTAFRQAANPCICPPQFPVCVCGRVSAGEIVTGKPILPKEEELTNNPRAKSAKLRIFQKSQNRKQEIKIGEL